MEKDDFAGQWAWFVVRRSLVHAASGFIIGAVWGAICIGLTGTLMGAVLGMLPVSASGTSTPGFIIGGIVGLMLGVATGGIVGLLSWAIVGIIAPPSGDLFPSSPLIRSTLGAMAIATVLAICCYFAWCAIVGLSGSGFLNAANQSVQIAMCGILAFMAVGQIAGVCLGVAQTKKLKVPAVQPET